MMKLFRRNLWTSGVGVAVSLTFLFLIGCSGSSDSPEDTTGGDGASVQDLQAQTDSAADLLDSDLAGVDGGLDTASEDTLQPVDTVKVVEPRCQALVDKWNADFMVDGLARSFVLGLPQDADLGGPWPVVFNWHGYGDSASNMHSLLSSQVDNDTMPFILVTPEDTNMPLGDGVDWDILKVNVNNREARLFDEVLECIDQKWGVDWERVHSVGFSAGGITTDLLGAMRGDVLASLVTFSGGYFSNADNIQGNLAMFVDWGDYQPSSPYPQLIIHGAETKDVWDAMVVKLEFAKMGVNDAAYLKGLGHEVVVCDHGGGHTIPFGLRGAQVVEFFAQHPRDGNSPWTALPASYPDYCRIVD